MWCTLVTPTPGRKVRSWRPSLAVEWVWSQLELPETASEGRKHQTVKLRWSALSTVTWEWKQTQTQVFCNCCILLLCHITHYLTWQLSFVETRPYLKYYWNNYLTHVNTASQLIKTPREQETRIFICWEWRVYSTIKPLNFWSGCKQEGGRRVPWEPEMHPLPYYLITKYKHIASLFFRSDQTLLRKGREESAQTLVLKVQC